MFGVVKNRLYKYLLKRLFGQYLDEDLDSAQVSVEGDTVSVRHLHLRSGSYRSLLDSACAELVTVQIPWRNLLQEGCQVTISGLTIEINAETDPADDDIEIESDSSLSSDDAYLHRALLRLFNREHNPDNLDNSGADNVTIGSNTKSIDCVTDYIHQVFAQTRIEAVDIRLDLRTDKGLHVVARIPSLRFQNGVLELDNGAELYDERVPAAPFFSAPDAVHISFNNQTISCEIDSIHGTIPIGLLSGLQSLAATLPRGAIHSEASDRDGQQSIADIKQLTLNVKSAAVVFESEEARFALSLETCHIDISVAPEFALRLCSVSMASIIDEISSIPVVWFAQDDQLPVFVLSSVRLGLKCIQISVNVYTLYRLKAMLKACLAQIPSRQAVVADRAEHSSSDFVVTLMGPTVLQYTGYLELTIDSEIIVALGSQSGHMSIESSSVRLREIQQDPVLLLSSKVNCRTRFSYADGCLPSLPIVPPNFKRTSRIFQLSDADSTEPDSLLLPVHFRREYLDNATISSSCEADHVAVYLNEHVLIGLYSAFKNHSQKPVASAVDLSKLAFSWAYNLDVREMTVLYKTHTSTFTVHAPSGISIFASSPLLNISLNSVSLKRDSTDILSHVAHSDDPAISTALEVSMIWRKERLDHSVTIRNVVLNVSHDVFDLVECGMSLYTTSKKIGAGYNVINRNCSRNRSSSFHINFEDCAILLSPAESSSPRLTLTFEKFSSAICDDRRDVLICGLSLHLLDELPAANLPSHIRSSLIEHLIDSGEVVIMSLDMAEGSFHPSAVSLDVGHITLMTSAKTFTSAYRAGLSFAEQISPRLSAIASSVRHYENCFSVSEQHDEAVLSSTQEVLLPKDGSAGGPPVPVDDTQDDVDSDLDDCFMFAESRTCRSDTQHSVASFVQESYCAVASASLPNENEMKAQYMNCDFSIVETHFASSVNRNPQQPYVVDQKVLDSEMNGPVLQLSLNLSIARIVLRLFGRGGGFKYRARRSPQSDRDQQMDPNKRYLVDLSEFIEEEFISFQKSFSTANGDRRLHRAPGDLIEVVLSGLQFSRRSYTSSATLPDSHSFDGTLTSIVIHDHVKESHFARVLGPLTKSKHRRNHCTKALVVSIESVNAASYCAEHRVEVQLGPLDLTLDGATLAFAIDFATGIESVLEPVVATPLEGERDTVQVFVNLDPTVYVHFFECDATAVNVTYRPANVDLGSIQSPAEFIKLLKLLPVQNAMFELKQVSLRGLSGYTRAVCEMAQIWARDIARNQYQKYLTSIVPRIGTTGIFSRGFFGFFF